MSPVVVLTIGASSVTVISDFTAPTCNRRSTLASSPTTRRMPLLDGVLKAGFGDSHFVLADGQRQHEIAPGVVRDAVSNGSGLQILRLHCR